MAKKDNILGISNEHGRLSLTLMKGGSAVKSAWADIPENIMQSGEIVSRNLYVELLKDTIKANGLSCKNAAYVIPSGNIFMRNLTMPKMTAEQVQYNLPFEFRDYVRGELKEYLFDYVYRPPLDADAEEKPVIDLFGVAVPAAEIETTRDLLKLAGMKLVKAVPEVITFESLLKKLPEPEEQMKERCFIDIGANSTRMLVFKNTRYKLTHMIDIGENRIIQTVADEMNVDMHIARTYLATNFQECQTMQAVTNAYRDISIEILKGLNFYEVSDMTSRLKDVVLCGGGAMIPPLVDLLKERVGMNAVTLSELLPELDTSGVLNITSSSLGILLDS